MKKIILLLFTILFSQLSMAASQLLTEPTENNQFLPANSPSHLNELLTPISETTALSSNNSDILLPVEQAFVFSVDLSQTDQITLEWLIAPGHYLYQSKFKFSLQGEGQLGTPEMPTGQTYVDPYFGQVTVYQSQLLHLVLPITRTDKTESIIVEYQGCAEKGFCYPPLAKMIIFTNPIQIIEATEATITTSTTIDKPVPDALPLVNKENAISALTLFIIACFFIIISVYLGVFDTDTTQVTGWQKLKKGIGVILLIHGILLMISAAGGQINLLKIL